MTTSPRHSWGDPVYFIHKTERECRKCGLVRVTKHEPSRCWTEFWNGLDKIESRNMPACISVSLEVGRAA
jgi:hypothetical protein